MASIRKELVLAAEPSYVWEVLRDVGAVHTRLARGFVTDTVLDGTERLVTFSNGFSVREHIVTIDDSIRRLVYSAAGGRTTHHNASFEVFADGAGRSRLVWIADLLPDTAATTIDGLMEQGVAAIRHTLESPQA